MEADLDTLAGELRERLLAAADADGAVAAPERIRALVEREAGVLGRVCAPELAGRIAERAFGLGPLEPLMADPLVEEVMVSGTAPVWVEREGRLERTLVRFAPEADCARRSSGSSRRSVAASTRPSRWPTPGSRTAPGSTWCIPPLALDGPALTIRRFRRRGFTGEDWSPAERCPLRC